MGTLIQYLLTKVAEAAIATMIITALIIVMYREMLHLLAIIDKTLNATNHALSFVKWICGSTCS